MPYHIFCRYVALSRYDFSPACVLKLLLGENVLLHFEQTCCFSLIWKNSCVLKIFLCENCKDASYSNHEMVNNSNDMVIARKFSSASGIIKFTPYHKKMTNEAVRIKRITNHNLSRSALADT